MNFSSIFAGRVMGYKPSEQLEADYMENQYLINNATHGSEDNVLNKRSSALTPSDTLMGGNLKDMFPPSNVLGKKMKGMEPAKHMFNKKIKGLEPTNNIFNQKVNFMGNKKNFLTSQKKAFNHMIKAPDMVGWNRMKMQKNLNLFGDHDGDKLMNIFDCNPLDKTKQGTIHKLANFMGGKGFQENVPVKFGGGEIPTYGQKGIGQSGKYYQEPKSQPSPYMRIRTEPLAMQSDMSTQKRRSFAETPVGKLETFKNTAPGGQHNIIYSPESTSLGTPKKLHNMSSAVNAIKGGESVIAHWAGQGATKLQAAGSALGHWAGQKAIPAVIAGTQKVGKGLYQMSPLATYEKEQEAKRAVLEQLKAGKLPKDVQKELIEQQFGINKQSKKSTLSKIGDYANKVSAKDPNLMVGSGLNPGFGQYDMYGNYMPPQSLGQKTSDMIGFGQGWSGQGLGIAQMSGQPTGGGFQFMATPGTPGGTGFMQMAGVGVPTGAGLTEELQTNALTTNTGVAKEATSDVGNSKEGVTKEITEELNFGKMKQPITPQVIMPTPQPAPVVMPTPQPAPVIVYDVSGRGQQLMPQPGYAPQAGGPRQVSTASYGPRGPAPPGKPIWSEKTKDWVAYKRPGKYNKRPRY